jgi:hypothetical protein
MYMKIRSFDWRDVSALHRYRKDCVYLHSAWLLTRGELSMPAAVLSVLTPSAGIFTSVCTPDDKDTPPLMAQAVQPAGSPFAQLTFLMPSRAVNLSTLAPVLEHLAEQMVERGALRLLADLDESSAVYEVMRQVGYVVYCRQRIWQLKAGAIPQNMPSSWQTVEEQDLIAVRSLYHNIVPPLVQQVETFPSNHLTGLVLRQGDEVLGYVGLRYGYRGIWIQPLFHPDMVNPKQALQDLAGELPYRFSRPLYVCVRSYQSWLETALEDLGAAAGPRQAVMVKHLAVGQRAVRPLAIPSLEGGQAEISAPFAHSENRT